LSCFLSVAMAMNDMHEISVRNTFIDFVPESVVASRRRCKSESDVMRFGLCAPDCAELRDLDDVATSDCCTSPRSVASSSWTSDEDVEPLDSWTWTPQGESWEEEDDTPGNLLELNLAAMLERPATEVDAWVRSGVTTVILRNIPNKYSLQQLLQEVVDRSCATSLDFAYLPLDTSSRANKGYAFLNFSDSQSAVAFREKFDGQSLRLFRSCKVARAEPASLQGRAANMERIATNLDRFVAMGAVWFA